MGFFYTGKGDKGESCIGDKKIAKDDPVIEALGEVDELNSLMGLLRSQTDEKTLREDLLRAQETLFIIQARLAWIMAPTFESPQITQEHVRRLEEEIEHMEREIGPERGFVIPGSSPSSAWLDYARAVSRRVERRIVALAKTREVPPLLKSYLNRLSSYLYALARTEAWRRGIQEDHPSY